MINNIQNITKVFTEFGDIIRGFILSRKDPGEYEGEYFHDSLETSIIQAELMNPWFTKEFQLNNLKYWANVLSSEKIESWLERYPQLEKKNTTPKKVGLVLAGNIPLVGLHDIICVLVSGNIAVTRLSSKDKAIYPVLRDILIKLDRSIKNKWILLDNEFLKEIDAVIATGSDNSSRYFEYYFGKYPHIIRKNRNSVAVIDGTETDQQMKALADDVFLYFGLGCRNISKLFVPEDFNPDKFYRNIEQYSYLYDHNKYANNYDYQKAILMVNKIPIYDNGFLVLKNDSSYASPVGTLYFEKYSSKESLKRRLIRDKDQLQCMVSKDQSFPEWVDFGMTQYPGLEEYADNIDTLEFLINL